MTFKELYNDAPERFADIEITGIYCDSRKVTENSVFVCIDGTFLDGHEYAKAAVQNGACVVFCQKDAGLDNQIIVDDSRIVYAALCAEFFCNPAKKLKLIGITGTSGKSSVAYMIKSLLEQQGKKVGLLGTIQNIIGDKKLTAKTTTPDAYELHSLFDLMHKDGCEYAVMEVSSHALDQNRVYGLEFECAVFTNLTQDHLDYHKTMENYRDAKAKLFRCCKKAIINADDEYSQFFIDICKQNGCEIHTFSTVSDTAEYTAKDIRYKTGSVSYNMVTTGAIGKVKIPIPGVFSVYNSMAAGVVGISLGADFDSVIECLNNVKGVKGRVEVVPSNRDFTMIIDYAHTPDELENVLKMLNQVKIGRIICVFGCGGDRDRAKRPIMGEISARLADYSIVTSDNPRSEKPLAIIEDILAGVRKYDVPYEVIESREEAIEFAISAAEKDDIVLFAGKGHETYQILNSGTIHFDEREVIERVLGKL